jgi:hypothetical protein
MVGRCVLEPDEDVMANVLANLLEIRTCDLIAHDIRTCDVCPCN